MSEVYFAASNGRIKIGFSTNVAARMKDLSGANPHEIEVIATIPGGRALEAKIHADLAAYRIKNEWFSDCAEVRAAPERYKDAAGAEVTRPSFRELVAAAAKADLPYEPDLSNVTVRFSRLMDMRLLDRLAVAGLDEKRRGLEKGVLMDAILRGRENRWRFSAAVDHLIWAHKMYSRILDACQLALVQGVEHSQYLVAAECLIRDTEAAFAPFASDIERLRK